MRALFKAYIARLLNAIAGPKLRAPTSEHSHRKPQLPSRLRGPHPPRPGFRAVFLPPLSWPSPVPGSKLGKAIPCQGDFSKKLLNVTTITSGSNENCQPCWFRIRAMPLLPFPGEAWGKQVPLPPCEHSTGHLRFRGCRVEGGLWRPGAAGTASLRTDTGAAAAPRHPVTV